jgi:hypothetical protein
METHKRRELMVLTRQELVAGLQKEVRILLHLAGKLDIAQLDYRPTSKQRSALELLRYLSYMGPALLRMAKTGSFDRDAWKSAIDAADQRNLDQTLAVIATLPDVYEQILSEMSDDDFRAEITAFDGSTISRGAFIVNMVLGGHAAYRTQLFLYLKSCGQEQLGTVNLWRGADAVPA